MSAKPWRQDVEIVVETQLVHTIATSVLEDSPRDGMEYV